LREFHGFLWDVNGFYWILMDVYGIFMGIYWYLTVLQRDETMAIRWREQ
jgi:hypothetical protein